MLNAVVHDLTALDITNAILGVAVLALWGVLLGGAAIEGFRRLRRRRDPGATDILRLIVPGADPRPSGEVRRNQA